jgi:hypothetical protein
MIFIVLVAIAFSLNNMYLAVEFSMVLILGLSPVFLAATRHVKNASVLDEREISNRNKDSAKFIIVLYFCFLMSILSACLLANTAWEFASYYFPNHLIDIRDFSYVFELECRILKSIKIMTDLLISWIMIRRFSGISHRGAIAKGA